MTLNPAAVHSLRRVFQQAFVVHDIAEPLVSFDDSTTAESLRSFMGSKRFEIVGIRTDGHVEGYVNQEELGNGPCAQYVRPFNDEQVILDSAPLPDLVLKLKASRRLFVSVLGRVGGIVSRSDLQKPPARMWLFGMVTLIEMRFSRLIERYCTDSEWQACLSDGRLQKADQLLNERIRLNQDLTMLDCLQLSDKAQIVARSAKLRSMTRFESRTQLEKSARMIERLRNNLAHSQDIVTNDWDAIVALSENLDAILDGPPGLQEE